MVEGILFERPCFLLILALLGPLTGTLIVVGRCLAFASFIAEESTDRFLPCSIVCYHIHELVDGLRMVPTQLPHQISVGGARDKGQDKVVVEDVRQLSALLREASSILSKSFSYFLLALAQVP